MTFEETRSYLSKSGTPEDLAVLDWLNELKERVEMEEKWTFPKPNLLTKPLDKLKSDML